jgi:uncharacterized protein DUF1569
MSTLADPQELASCCARIGRLEPDMRPQWGRMTAHQAICHLNDSFRVGTGEKFASPHTNLFMRTVGKWVALRSSVTWPRGVGTRPEVEQGKGGTPPSDWERDRAELLETVAAFPQHQQFAAHPIFGRMSRRDWLAWGYRHVDHHLRQFGV